MAWACPRLILCAATAVLCRGAAGAVLTLGLANTMLENSGDVVIGAEYTAIEGQAFKDTAVTSVSFEAGGALTSIGAKAFYGCSLLNGALELPASLETIGVSAFQTKYSEALPNTGGVTSVTFAAAGALTSIGDRAFQGSHPAHPHGGAKGSLGGALELPASLETIGTKAFINTAVTSLSFAAAGALTRISPYAFYGCSSLSGVLELPASLETIGDMAFAGVSVASVVCSRSASLTIASRVFHGVSFTATCCAAGQYDTGAPVALASLSECSSCTFDCVSLPGAPPVISVRSAQQAGYDGAAPLKILGAFVVGDGNTGPNGVLWTVRVRAGDLVVLGIMQGPTACCSSSLATAPFDSMSMDVTHLFMEYSVAIAGPLWNNTILLCYSVKGSVIQLSTYYVI